MGIAQTLRAVVEGVKAGPIGYPAPGWQPPSGHVGTSTSGVTITEDRANTVAAWFASIRVISEDVAGLPLILYRRDGRARQRATDHPLYRLLHDEPNPEMTSMVFRETLQAHALAWGNGYAEKELNGSGRTIALWPLRPDRMEVTWENGRRVYTYTRRLGETPVRFPAGRIFHLQGIGGDGLTGWSVLRYARETLGSAIALRDYGNRVVKNDARPGTILHHPGTLSDKARANLKQGWVEANERDGPGRTALLEEGITLTQLGLPSEDLLFLTSQQWQVTEVARWMRIAPHKIGDLTRSTNNNIEEQGIDHVVSTLRAWLVRWEQQLNKDVVQDPTLFAEHLLDAFLRGKTLERAQANAIRTQWLAMTPNEWRAMENDNPVEWGDEPVRGPNNTSPTTPPPQDPAGKSFDLIVHNHPADVTVNTPEVKVAPAEVHVAGSTLHIDSLAVANESLDQLGDRIMAAQDASAKALAAEVRGTGQALGVAVAAVGGSVKEEVKAAARKEARTTTQRVEYDANKRAVLVITSDGTTTSRKTITRGPDGEVLSTEETEEPA